MTAGAAAAPQDDTPFPGAAPYLVWSRYHNAWWGKNSSGYTADFVKAGRYSEAEADRICKVRDPLPNGDAAEVKVPAPEANVRPSHAIVERIGWQDSEEDGTRRFTATLVFPSGPPELPFCVVWDRLPVVLSLVLPSPPARSLTPSVQP